MRALIRNLTPHHFPSDSVPPPPSPPTLWFTNAGSGKLQFLHSSRKPPTKDGYHAPAFHYFHGGHYARPHPPYRGTRWSTGRHYVVHRPGGGWPPSQHYDFHVIHEPGGGWGGGWSPGQHHIVHEPGGGDPPSALRRPQARKEGGEGEGNGGGDEAPVDATWSTAASAVAGISCTNTKFAVVFLENHRSVVVEVKKIR